MTTDDYLNFDLAIEPDAGGYLASVRASPGGDASESFEVPFTPEGLENLVLKLGRSRTIVRRVATSHDRLAERFGRDLFEAAMSGNVGFAYHSSLQEAERQGKGLRLRLNLDRAPELADVPWELLYSPTLHRPLALSTQTPIVRYIGLPFAAKPLTVEAPLRVLVVVAAPTDLVDLDTDAEVARIRDATEDLARSGLVHIDQLENATLIDLVRHLETTDCHVLHFVGHGGYEQQGDSGSGVLAFENGDRLHQLVSGDRLGVLLNDHVPLRLAVLNACEGARTSPTEPFAGVAQSLVRQGIPAVIAMQFEVTDTAATVFGHELYRALATGCPIDKATAIARKAMLAGNHDVEWATPVLYLRATSGHLFDVHGGDGSPPEPIDTELVDWYADATAAFQRWSSTRSRDDLEEAVALLEQVARRKPDFRGSEALLTEARDALAGLPAMPESTSEGPPEPTVGEVPAVDDGAGSRPTETIPPVERDAEVERSTPMPPAPPPAVASTWDEEVEVEVEVETSRWRKPVLAAIGVVVLVGLASLLIDGDDDGEDELAVLEDAVDSADEADGPDEPDDVSEVAADFAVRRVASPSLGGDNAWADDLERYPTPHPAEGDDEDPQVSSTWALAWDDDHLYLAVDVVDDLVETPYADEPHRIYRGDGINFHFGRSTDGLASDAPLREDDVQIMVGPANAAADSAVAGIQFARRDGATCRLGEGPVFEEGRAAPEITATSRRTSDGYRLAAAVPWSLLGPEPEVGDVYGVILSVADADTSRPVARPRGSRSTHPDRFTAKHCPGQWQNLALHPG